MNVRKNRFQPFSSTYPLSHLEYASIRLCTDIENSSIDQYSPIWIYVSAYPLFFLDVATLLLSDTALLEKEAGGVATPVKSRSVAFSNSYLQDRGMVVSGSQHWF